MGEEHQLHVLINTIFLLYLQGKRLKRRPTSIYRLETKDRNQKDCFYSFALISTRYSESDPWKLFKAFNLWFRQGIRAVIYVEGGGGWWAGGRKKENETIRGTLNLFYRFVCQNYINYIHRNPKHSSEFCYRCCWGCCYCYRITQLSQFVTPKEWEYIYIFFAIFRDW